MLRVLSQAAVVLVFATALGAAPGNSTPDSNQAIKEKAKPPSPPVKGKRVQVGRASWYGRLFQHKPTASGEQFDMYQFTAAHRTLPMGSWVRVTNLKNERSVVVRINDRGPMPRSRIIDLSYGAAKMLQMGHDGVDRVRLDVLQTPMIAQNEGPQ